MNKLEQCLEKIAQSASAGKLIKITTGSKRKPAAELANIFVRPVNIKGKAQLSFVFRYPTNDITKNFEIGAALDQLSAALRNDFYNCDVYLAHETLYYSADAAGQERLRTKSAAREIPPVEHDKEKLRLVDASAEYLFACGVTNRNGSVKNEMQHKFRQIDRYVRLVDGLLKNETIGPEFRIVDMGSGKGYLSFALYDHLRKTIPDIKMRGVEQRKNLVEQGNRIAQASGFTRMHFEEGSIAETAIEGTDMLIALHACDTATDDAIAKGIKAGVKYIICAPCCHKQVRREMKPVNALHNITQHGILLERQAETVTDTIRAMLLQKHGYRTNVFEFIEEADTPKNVMIAGILSESPNVNAEKIDGQIAELKHLFGLKSHYLETLLHG